MEKDPVKIESIKIDEIEPINDPINNSLVIYINDSINRISTIVYMLFTPFPYTIYNISTNSGNMAYAGVALGLINSQRIFWLSNMGMITIFYFINNPDLIYINLGFSSIFGFFYMISFLKTIEMINLLEIPLKTNIE
jgi:hypothetical protein